MLWHIFQSDEVYLEAQIQNITPGAIYMEKVSLEPSAQYTAVELNLSKSANKYVFFVSTSTVLVIISLLEEFQFNFIRSSPPVLISAYEPELGTINFFH